MILVKRFPWILLGIVFGVGFGMAPRIKAQEHAAQPQRLVRSSAMQIGSGEFGFFVSDSKTGSCWLGVQENGSITALATAPREACQ
jgi:hypothetical protein